MFSKIEELIPENTLKEIKANLDRLEWQDGKKTAGSFTDKKNNEQITINTPGADQMIKQIGMQLLGNIPVRNFARLKKISRLMFGRYSEGSFYGYHTDASFQSGGGMGQGRADISFTIFLNSPDDYEGGELLIQSPLGEMKFKEDAGSAVFYDSGLLHQVTEVKKGSRLVIIGWAEAWIAAPDDREDIRRFNELLLDHAEKNGQDEFYYKMMNLRSNLERKFAR